MLYYIGIVLFMHGFNSGVETMTTNAPVLCNLTTSDACPTGHCCVRDEFLFSYTYCRPFGVEGQPCSIKPSMFECHCADGLMCYSNIHGMHESLFGHCRKSEEPSTTKTTNDLIG